MIIYDRKIIETAAKDLSDDFNELQYLLSSQEEKMKRFHSAITRLSSQLHPAAVKYALQRGRTLIHTNQSYQARIQRARSRCNKIRTHRQFYTLYHEKQVLDELTRIYYSETAGVLSSLDWQSPTFLHSGYAMAGKQTGKIMGTINDYKRDQHLDAQTLEKQFLKEYVDSLIKYPAHIYATTSGMGAFTTILHLLLTHKKIQGPILMGTSVYFETKSLINTIFAGAIHEVDEHDTKKMLSYIDSVQPSVVILDSLANSHDITMPNISEVIKHLNKTAKKDTYLILDNTCLSITCQPFRWSVTGSKRVHILVYESLNKYYQFGLDRVTGGMVWGMGRDAAALFYSREHSGTNITDTSSLAVPTPNRALLTKRLRRFERNALFLAAALQAYIVQSPRRIFSHIVYPGLPSHPANSWNNKLPFHGCFFTIAFSPKYQNVRLYKRFVSLVIQEAKKQKVILSSGTSFGFNTTRIYLTALRADYGQPFVRVAVGTEPHLIIQKLQAVFTTAMENMKA